MYPNTKPQQDGLGWADLAVSGAVSGVQVLTGLFTDNHYRQWESDGLPACAAKAGQTKLPVLIFWFGSVFRVDPYGTYEELITREQSDQMFPQGANSANYKVWINQWAQSEPFWLVTGGDVHNLAPTVTFQLYGNPQQGTRDNAVGEQINPAVEIFPTSPTYPQSTTLPEPMQAGMSGIVFPLVAIGGAFLLAKSFKKGKRK